MKYSAAFLPGAENARSPGLKSFGNIRSARTPMNACDISDAVSFAA